MVNEAIAASTAVQAAAPVAGGPGDSPSFADIQKFEAAMFRAAENSSQAVMPLDASQSTMLSNVVDTLEGINARAARIADQAEAAAASKSDMKPGDMVMLTVRCHEFLFHCQLTSNAANRTSDGLQQLFRQQA